MKGVWTDLAVMGRVALGAFLGYAIGWEREHRGSAAGDRTFALVALGAAGFTAVGVENFPATAEKVIAGIVTGIGFLGAGLIMRGSDGGEIRGLTTAAALWASASMGIFAGAGEPVKAVFVTLLILFILEAQHTPGLRRAFHADLRSETQDGDGDGDGD